MYTSMYILMMVRRCVSIAQARTELPDIVDAVEAGADVELTRRGHLVAVITSPARLRGARPSFADAYATFLKDHTPATDGVLPSFFRHLRDRGPGRPFRI
jgi:prevent-host-death family protein